jgi:hypothetical protein
VSKQNFIENVHYYLENGKVVFTEVYLSERGWCCGNKCRHCPYFPKYERGNTNITEKEKLEDK